MDIVLSSLGGQLSRTSVDLEGLGGGTMEATAGHVAILFSSSSSFHHINDFIEHGQ